MCLSKLPTPFELGYRAKPQDQNPFPIESCDYERWYNGVRTAAEERAIEEDERARENYFAWSSWDQE